MTQESDRRVHETISPRGAQHLVSFPPFSFFRHLSGFGARPPNDLTRRCAPPSTRVAPDRSAANDTTRSAPSRAALGSSVSLPRGDTRSIARAPSREANFLLGLGASKAPPSDARRRRRGARGRARREIPRTTSRVSELRPVPHPSRPFPPLPRPFPRHFPRNAACQRAPRWPAHDDEQRSLTSGKRHSPPPEPTLATDPDHASPSFAQDHAVRVMLLWMPATPPTHDTNPRRPAHAREEAPHLVSRGGCAAKVDRRGEMRFRGSEVDVASLAGDGRRGERRG